MTEGKAYDLKIRTFDFAQEILNIADELPQNYRCDVLRRQLIKSGTSIGANIEEADGAITKKDFANKMVIARKEARETYYWLRLLSERYIKKDKVVSSLVECKELISILSAIINKVR